MNQEIHKQKPFTFWLFLLAALVFLLTLTKHFFVGFNAGQVFYLLEVASFFLLVSMLYLTERQYHRDKKAILEITSTFTREKTILTQQMEQLQEKLAACTSKTHDENHLLARHQELLALIREKAKKPALSQGFLSAIAEGSQAMSAILYKEIKPSGEFIVEATYGLPETYSPASFVVGEGLNGQVAADGTPLVMEEVPDDYFQVTSGLGQAKPRCLCFLPLMKDNRCIALIELASFIKNDLDLLWPKVSAVVVEEELF